MLHLYHSNRLEQLAEGLAGNLARPLADPMASETVVVQHPGMGRWLSLQLARHLGICANTDFPLPGGYIWQLLRQLLDNVPEQDGYQPVLIRWWLFTRLGRPLSEPVFAPLNGYLRDADQLMRYQLAGEIAHCFDQYLVYRPDWISAWQLGSSAVAGDGWQALLWRELVQDQQNLHWVDLQRRLGEAACAGGIHTKRLPERVSLFALSSLSPGYLEILHFAAEWMDIHLYLLNPGEGLWMDQVSEQEQGRRTLQAEAQACYLELGDPLLASLGGQGRDFFSLLLAYDPGAHEHFVEPEGRSLLAQLQRGILHQQTESAADPIDPADSSLQIHLCHSPMRELEVLHDQLLSRFAADDSLLPSDILVMTPDMDSYAPYIEAVFGETPDQAQIPYTLSDRSQLGEAPLIASFLQLLTLPGGRYPVTGILALLEQPAVHRRFALEAGDLPRIRHWVEQVAIRWGRDGSEREALELPVTDQNSWQAGLDRLLLGFALPGADDQLFQGILPCDAVEGSDAQILGGLHAFLSALFELETLLLKEATPAQWEARLTGLIDRFFAPDEQELEQQEALRNAILRVVEGAGLAGFQGLLCRDLIVTLLEDQLAAPSAGRFLGGGVNFCALTPMRALPFRVICMIGMNDGLFPRDRPPTGFDLMSRDNPRPGDRSRRADDRYLFLETLISARDQLYLSYVGQDIRDNSSLPPSVLVSELIDAIDSRYPWVDERAASEALITRHPLQPFNPRYFMANSGLFSYSVPHCEGAAALRRDAAPARPLIQQALAPPEAHWRQVEVGQLIGFFRHPVRYLLNQRLGISLTHDQDALESREPFELDYFTRSALFERLVEGRLRDQPPEQLLALERGRGELPHGTAGRVLFEQLAEQATRFAAQLPALDYAAERYTVNVDFQHGAMRLMGRLEQVAASGLFGYSLDKLPDAALLTLWIRHLVLNVSAPPGIDPVTRWLSEEGLLRFGTVDQAPALLGDLLALYWEGLQQPLHLFVKSSRRYASLLHEGKSADYALQQARERWFGGFQGFAEYDNPYYRLAFPGGEVLDARFESLSQRLFEPLLQAMEVN